ncbi:MAG: hypothetical protein MJK15_06040 [Colwellia sp.]|nr:hypothetical protein [Colwellia sp.]
MKNLIKVLVGITLVIGMTSHVSAKPNSLFTLENLERQRAVLLNNLTTKQLNAYQREQQTKRLIKRLVDLERMVLRDDRIAASNSIMAKNAFQHYELTFLIHAGSESKKSPIAQWLHSLKITDESITKSSSGVR